MEHAYLITFLDVPPFVSGDLAAGNFGHSNCQDTHHSYVRVVGFNEYNTSRVATSVMKACESFGPAGSKPCEAASA